VHFDPKIVRAFLSVEADIKKESIRLRNDKSKSYDFEQTQGQMEGQEGKYAKQS
jgi:HD-GYP domain-containing protein (c-di-GMP phosphodiesterase class II)